MILAKLNQPEFEYDIHSLIKAFFPEENVSATAEDKKYEEEITFQFQVEYEPQQIKIEWKGKNQESHDRSFPVDFSDRTETKNELKQNFYQILSEITGKKLPWGTLAGNPANENPDEIFRGRKNGGRDQSLHAKNVLCIR